jgi:hypothetical protein
MRVKRGVHFKPDKEYYNNDRNNSLDVKCSIEKPGNGNKHSKTSKKSYFVAGPVKRSVHLRSYS